MDDGKSISESINRLKKEADSIPLVLLEWKAQRRIVVEKVMKHMDWDIRKALLWWHTENPMFGCISPVQMVKMNRGEKLIKAVDNMIEGNIA